MQILTALKIMPKSRRITHILSITIAAITLTLALGTRIKKIQTDTEQIDSKLTAFVLD